MNNNPFAFRPAFSNSNRRYYMDTIIKLAIIMLLSVFQLKSNCFAQQNSTGELPVKPDTISFETEVKDQSTVHTISNYSTASYPGGNNAFVTYLIHNIIPPNVREDAIITVTFTISESGKLVNMTASEGPHKLKKEAIRVIKHSGRWIPAYRDGKPIASEQSQRISFMLNQ